MAIKHVDEYRDAQISKKLAEEIKKNSRQDIRLMEVCGTHTMSIFRNGIRNIIPASISLISGPGCPVCVTAQNEIDAFIELAGEPDTIVGTFGDLMRVPGTGSSLQKEHANGRDIRMVYSTFDALEIAVKNPDKRVVFLGVGFETTAPTIAASILAASKMKIGNFLVYSAHKTVPAALSALVDTKGIRIDGFILPGHVSVIIGTEAYLPFFNKYRMPCVVAGFEPADILQALLMLVRQIDKKSPMLENAYSRAVSPEGNKKAVGVMNQVFEPADVAWRGIGIIPESGLKIRDEFSDFDAKKQFKIRERESKEPKGCSCGEILTGLKTPVECLLYRKVCTPVNPIGPCMVSSEGTCAAYYKYHSGDQP
jgi:hydrogenase expression/formation protein HypD